MNKFHKEIARYVLLALLTLMMYKLTEQAYLLESNGKLTMQFAGVVATYLGTWGYVIKWFFTSTVGDKHDHQL